MKYIIFFTVLIFGTPGIIAMLMSYPRYAKYVIMVITTFTVFSGNVSINFFSHETYRGTSRGMEVSLLDILSLSLLIFMLLSKKYKVRFWAPGMFFYLLYFISGWLSMTNAANKLFTFMELWKMMMMYMAFIVFYNYISNTRDVDSIMLALGIVTTLSFFKCLEQRYILHIYQSSGLFPHQNSMAMYMGFIGPIFLMRWLHGPDTGWRRARTGLFFIMVTASVFISLSRSTMTFYPVVCAMAVIISLIHGWRIRQMKIIGFLAIVGIVGLSAVLPTVINRFVNAPKSSGETRINFAIAALNMAKDKKLGVGMNNWGIKINPPYEYAQHREKRNMPEDEKDGLVETIYLMVAAECGWWALGVLVFWFATYYLINLWNIWANFRTPWFYLPVGIFAGMTLNYVQSAFEWVLKQATNFYLLMIMFAITVAFLKINKAERKERRLLRRQELEEKRNNVGRTPAT